jgi:hypothetical protein
MLDTRPRITLWASLRQVLFGTVGSAEVSGYVSVAVIASSPLGRCCGQESDYHPADSSEYRDLTLTGLPVVSGSKKA